jgi:hypothetical protein
MKVTIEGNLDQVSEALSLPQTLPKTSRQTRIQETVARYDALVARRKVIRAAFDKVRYSQDEREIAKILLDALTKAGGITEPALELAHKVLRYE